MWAYKNRWKESNSQVIHNVQSLMPRPWSPFKTWRSTFFVGHCIIWIIMIMGSYRSRDVLSPNFVCFCFALFFLFSISFRVQTSSFKLGFPSTTVKPNHMHHIPKTKTSKQKQRILEKILDLNILENPESPSFFFLFWVVISIVFFFSFALSGTHP